MTTYLHNKRYRIFVNATLLNAIGNSLFNIVFIVYASTLSFNTVAVSLASVAIFLPSFFQPFLGHWADKTKDKLKWSIYTKLLQFLLFIILAGAILLPPTFTLFTFLLLINIITDCLGFFSSSLQLPYVKHLVPVEELNDAFGFNSALQTLIQLIFQGFGALAIVQLNYNFSLFGIINALTFLGAATILITHFKSLSQIKLNQQEATDKISSSFKEDLKTTLQIFLNNPFLKMIILFAFLINLLGTSTDGLLNVSILSREALWFSNLPNTIALLGMSTSIGMLLGALLTKDFFQHIKSFTIISLLLLVTTLIPIILLIIESKELLILSLFVLGYLLGKINPRLSAYLISEVPQEQLGLTSGMFSVLVMAGTPLGQLVFLGSANLLNDTISWILFGSFSLLFLGISLVSTSKIVDPITTKKLSKEG